MSALSKRPIARARGFCRVCTHGLASFVRTSCSRRSSRFCRSVVSKASKRTRAMQVSAVAVFGSNFFACTSAIAWPSRFLTSSGVDGGVVVDWLSFQRNDDSCGRPFDPTRLPVRDLRAKRRIVVNPKCQLSIALQNQPRQEAHCKLPTNYRSKRTTAIFFNA